MTTSTTVTDLEGSHDPLQGWDADGYEPRTADIVAQDDRTAGLAVVGALIGAAVGGAVLGRRRRVRAALSWAALGAVTGVVIGRMTRPTI